ncbi:MAG: hypothetical protein IIC51_07505, partial [Planctomycetes bacterium]|nr:hypothetical protein [Planctomycetota bacterium]
MTGQTVGEVFFAYGYEETLSSASVPAGSSAGDLHVIGEQFTLVLLLNFLDDLSEPNTVAEVEDMVFSDSNPLSVNSRLRENSYGKAWLAGDVLDWLTLPINAGACAGYLRPFSSIFRNTVDFVDDLVDFSLYTRIIVLKPSNDCTVGAVGSFGDFPIATDEGQFQVSLAVGVLAPSVNTPATISHELGHNYEMTHHGALECGDAAVGDYTDGCDNIQRGRPYDPMARSGQGQHNASSKHRLGWFDPQNIAALGTGTHEITLFPLELPSDQVQTVRIPAAYILPGGSESAYYVIEYRQAIGLDASHTELDDPQAGVLLNLEERDYLLGPVLLDMSPHVTTEDFSQSEDIEEDAFLRLGQTFTDTKHGITVTFS